MFERIYVEIGNVCNLHCSFCPTVKRKPRQLTTSEFAHICEKIKAHTSYIYLHVMGEPLLHRELDSFLSIAAEHSLRVCITTNGTLLAKERDVLLSHAKTLHKVSISLHCIEGNEGANLSMDEYLTQCFDFSRCAAEEGIYTVFRLWNLDENGRAGANAQNTYIENALRNAFDQDWTPRRAGFRLQKNIFLEYAPIFTWPTQSDAEPVECGHCHGMLDQLAILVDGSVVPCCLDSEGEIHLGNIFDKTLDDILSSKRAVAMRDSLRRGELSEELCKRCTYARRFKK